MKGTISKIFSDKNFGFITPEDGTKDVFFHASQVVGVQFSDLNAEDVVTFEVEETPKGPSAVNVTKE